MSMIEIEGACIHVYESGHGDPVVMLHSSASSGGQWRPVADLLENAHVMSPDLFGCGKSENWPGTRPYTLSDEARIVECLAKQARRPMHVVGHSYGGAVALRFALSHPEQVASLTLIEPVAFHLLNQRGYFDRTLYGEISIVADAVSEAIIKGDYESGMSCFVDYWNGESAWSRFSDSRRRQLSGLASCVARQFWAATNEQASLDDFRKIHAPTLVVSGGRSPSPVRWIAQLIAGTVPHARLQSYRSAGHMLPITHPGTVAGLITDRLVSAGEPVLRAA